MKGGITDASSKESYCEASSQETCRQETSRQEGSGEEGREKDCFRDEETRRQEVESLLISA